MLLLSILFPMIGLSLPAAIANVECLPNLCHVKSSGHRASRQITATCKSFAADRVTKGYELLRTIRKGLKYARTEEAK